MKKLIAAVLLCVTAAALVCCSAKNENPTDMLAVIMTDMDMSPSAMIWFDSADPSDKSYMPRELAGYLYTGKSDSEFDALDSAESFAVYIGSGLDVCELHIYKAKSLSECDRLLWMLNSRAAVVNSLGEESYFRTQLTTKGVKAETKKFGKYAVMAATPDNDAVFAYFDSIL